MAYRRIQWGSSEGYFAIAKERWHPKWCQTEMEHINHHFRQGDMHRFAYDFKTLYQALSSAGFQEIQRRDFNPELDSLDRKLGSLYVDAFKQNTTSSSRVSSLSIVAQRR